MVKKIFEYTTLGYGKGYVRANTLEEAKKRVKSSEPLREDMWSFYGYGRATNVRGKILKESKKKKYVLPIKVFNFNMGKGRK